ncbi:MAG: DUF3757 domain-containing protein [Pseudomonadota bacterium]|nr:DUF3757 domain-containing protein [Pseudomonadota bacterium]
MTIPLLLLPTLGSASVCPTPKDIKLEDGHYSAITSDGKWVSTTAAEDTKLTNLSFWHVRGQLIGNPGKTPIVKVNNLTCAYFSSGSKVVWLTTSGYPKKKYTVNRASWELNDMSGLLSCMSYNVTSCEFTPI